MEFYGEVLEVDSFTDRDALIIHEFAKIVVQRAALEKRAVGTESHLDVMVECLKRKADDMETAGCAGGPLPGLRAAPAYRRGGPGGPGSMAQRDQRERAKWAAKLSEVLVKADAPVLEGLSEEEIPDYVQMLIGKARPGTVRLRVHTWQVYLRWLGSVSDRSWPRDVRDLVDYVRAMVNVPAAAYFPRVFASAVHWFGGRSGFKELEAAGADPRFKRAVEWAEVELSSGTLQKRKAPRLPVAVMVAMELLVLDVEVPIAIRVTAWYRLVKVYGGLRWDDLQRLLPKNVEMKDMGLVGRMLQTKVSGPGRKVRELPLFVSREADLTGGGWLHVGFDLWLGTVDVERDFFIARPVADMTGYTDKMATDVDAMTMGRVMFGMLKVPTMAGEDGKEWNNTEALFLPGGLADSFTNHSERATLVSALAAIGVDKERRSMVGRWSADGSDEYVRTYRAVLRDLAVRFTAAVRSGNSYVTLDEEDAFDQMGVWLVNHGLDKEHVDHEIGGAKELAKMALALWSSGQGEAAPTEVASLSPLDVDGGVEEKVKDYQYLIVYTRGRRCARLHAAQGCWRARQMLFRDVELIGGELPDRKSYNRICKECWPGQPTVPSEGWLQGGSDEEESGSSSSSSAAAEDVRE